MYIEKPSFITTIEKDQPFEANPELFSPTALDIVNSAVEMATMSKIETLTLDHLLAVQFQKLPFQVTKEQLAFVQRCFEIRTLYSPNQNKWIFTPEKVAPDFKLATTYAQGFAKMRNDILKHTVDHIDLLRGSFISMNDITEQLLLELGIDRGFIIKRLEYPNLSPFVVKK